MKKALIMLGVLGGVLVLAFVVTSMLARNAERKTEAALARLVGSTGAKPQVLDKNDLALALEPLADPLGIELRPRDRSRTASRSQTPAVIAAMGDWLREQEEKPTDEITPPPADVQAWLDGHREALDAIADRIVAEGTPRWPVNTVGAPINQPIPNLLGHMHLFRILTAASLERELRGDHTGAWHLQQAAWNLTRGLFDRPETISALIGVAGVRLQVATQRKLEPPIPAWVAETSKVRLHREILEALRTEMGNTARFARGGSYLRELLAMSRHQPSKTALIGEAVISPIMRWAVAENMTVAIEELDALRDADPCAASRQRFDERLRQKRGPVAQRFSFVVPELSNAITRAAIADVAVEGTSKVLAAKVARDAAVGAWPSSIPAIEQSRCSDARWLYAVDASGAMSLKFEGNLRQPEGSRMSRIPLEFRADG